MNKNNGRKIFGRKKVFDTLKIGKKDLGIKKNYNTSNFSVKKNYKLLKGVNYGNDINYQRYMAYLDKLREEEETGMNKNEHKKNKNNCTYDLDKNILLSKKISFSDFSHKFKINPYIMQYFDYYDIQKINRKEVERNIKTAKNKRPIKIVKESIDESEILEEDKNQNSIICVNKTEDNFDEKYNNIYENLMTSSNYVREKSYNKSQKNNKKIHLSGIDFNLINKISTETLKVKKKIEKLKYINELNKEKERLYKRINKTLNDPYSKHSHINYNIDNLIDEFTIFHRVEPKNIRKLNNLRINLEKNTEENIPKKKKLSKTLYENNPTYYIYIPNSAKYKHISYHKECLFNKEFDSNKKARKRKSIISLNKQNNKFSSDFLNDIKNINTINYLIKTQKNYFNNSNFYYMALNSNLKEKSNKIIKNLKEIKNLMKKDKNYTSKSINRASKKYHENENIKLDQKLMENVMKDDRKNINKIKEIQKKRKIKKINEKNNVFSTLKQINDCYAKDRKIYSEMNIQFSRSLNALCRKEKKENKNYQRILKNNYHLKLENEDNESDNFQLVKNNINHRQRFVNSLNAKIQKKCLDINNIIAESKLKTEASKF